MNNNVLYCGMADDILSPIQLVPTFDVLYVICKLDMAFARNHTWEGQKEDIIQQLTIGTDKLSHHREVMLGYSHKKLHNGCPWTLMPDKAQIISDEDENNIWTLVFNYCGKTRKMVYYHHTDFIQPWPNEIQQIGHLMSMGATFPLDDEILIQNIKERTIPNFIYYRSKYDKEYDSNSTYYRLSDRHPVEAKTLLENVIKEIT